MSQQEFSESLDKLTPQQREVLSRILAGEPDAEIAASLGIKLATVRKYVQRIYQAFESFISSKEDDRRSRRGDLFALFAQYKPELLGTGTPVDLDRIIDEKRNSLASLSNPFVPLTGMVDDRRLFFDRSKEIRNVFEILNSGSSVAIVGDRGIGKSSLLRAICREAKSYLHQPREPVYLNLQLMADEDDFYKALCEEVGIEESRGYALTRALKDRRLLLAIDKVEKMTWEEFSSHIPSQLRGLADGSDAPLRLVLAASKSLDKLFQETGKVSPFTNICIEVNLGLWDSDIARAFIADRLDSTPVTFSEEDISQIIRASKGHPQQLMRLCHKTYEGYKEKIP